MLSSSDSRTQSLVSGYAINFSTTLPGVTDQRVREARFLGNHRDPAQLEVGITDEPVEISQGKIPDELRRYVGVQDGSHDHGRVSTLPCPQCRETRFGESLARNDEVKLLSIDLPDSSFA